MDLELGGKVGIVTGASRGIGREIARELGRERATVVLVARDARALDEAVGEVRSLGGQARAVACDLSEPGAAALVADAVRSAFGRLDFVVTNAGAARGGDFLTLTDADWHDGFSLKFFGHVRLLRTVWPDLSASRGSVVIIAGRAGRTPGAAAMIAGAVNAALANFTKALAARGIVDRVRVNAVNPGVIRTDRHAARLRREAEAMGCDEAEAEDRLIAHEEIIGVGSPSDVAAVVALLLSPRGGYLHGSLVDVDGGRTKTV